LFTLTTFNFLPNGTVLKRMRKFQLLSKFCLSNLSPLQICLCPVPSIRKFAFPSIFCLEAPPRKTFHQINQHNLPTVASKTQKGKRKSNSFPQARAKNVRHNSLTIGKCHDSICGTAIKTRKLEFQTDKQYTF